MTETIVISLLVVFIIWRELWHSFIERDILNRLMSRDFAQYQAITRKPEKPKAEIKVEYETTVF